jgi:hypothetical protein
MLLPGAGTARWGTTAGCGASTAARLAVFFENAEGAYFWRGLSPLSASSERGLALQLPYRVVLP